MKLTTKLKRLEKNIKDGIAETDAFIFPCGHTGKALARASHCRCDNCSELEDCIEFYSSRGSKQSNKNLSFKRWQYYRRQRKKELMEREELW